MHVGTAPLALGVMVVGARLLGLDTAADALASVYLVVATMLGTRQLGFFYIAARLPYQMYQLGATLSRALLATFSRAGRSQLERGVGITVRFSAFFI